MKTIYILPKCYFSGVFGEEKQSVHAGCFFLSKKYFVLILG